MEETYALPQCWAPPQHAYHLITFIWLGRILGKGEGYFDITLF
jgi:hypothetical protein